MVAVVDNCRIGRGPSGKALAHALQARTLASSAASVSKLLSWRSLIRILEPQFFTPIGALGGQHR
jgi:hypothetical protein